MSANGVDMAAVYQRLLGVSDTVIRLEARMATKDDLKSLATKQELAESSQRLEALIKRELGDPPWSGTAFI